MKERQSKGGQKVQQKALASHAAFGKNVQAKMTHEFAAIREFQVRRVYVANSTHCDVAQV